MKHLIFIISYFFIVLSFEVLIVSCRKYFTGIDIHNISNVKFPITIKVPPISDIFLVKCPGNEYKFGDERNVFRSSPEIKTSGINYKIQDDMFRQYFVNFRILDQSVKKFSCGTYYLAKENRTIKWSYNLLIPQIPDEFEIMKTFTEYSKSVTNCSCYHNIDTINYYKTFNEIIKEGLPKEGEIVKDLIIYSFPKIGYHKDAIVLRPCKILKPISEVPIIRLKDYKDLELINSDKNIYFLPKKFYEREKYTFQLVTPSGDYIFYSNEKVHVTNIKYTDINKYSENGNKQLTNEITVHGYGIYDVNYRCDICKEGTNIDVGVTFFFGPEKDTEVVEELYKVFLEGSYKKSPRCVINRFSYAYLSTVMFNDVVVNFDDIKKGLNNETFSISKYKDKVTYHKEKNPSGTLTCIYQTPMYKISTKFHYIVLEPAIELLNHSSEPIKLDRISYSDLYEEISQNYDLSPIYDELSITGVDSKKDDLSTIIIIIIVIVLIAIPIFFIYLFVKKDLILLIYHEWVMKHRYPNIYLWWSLLRESNLAEYGDIIYDSSYIPESSKKKDKPREDLIFHYPISLTISKKIYFWSDGPPENKVNQFWELLFKRNISVVLAIIYHKRRKEDYDVMNYCPKIKGSHKFGDIIVQNMKPYYARSPQTIGVTYEMKNSKGKIKTVTILHYNGWQIHRLPENLHYALNPLYEEIKALAKANSNRVLIHTSRGPDSRVFTFTYFSLILEAMENDITDEPMDVIEEIRKQYIECFISPLEYIFIQSALIECLYNRGILLDMKHRIIFLNRYKVYLFNLFLVENNMKVDIREFLWFCYILDEGKLRNICSQLPRTGIMDKLELGNKCKRFFKVLENPSMKDKIRIPTIPCLDAFSVDCDNHDKDPNDMSGFLHANSITYMYNFNEEQKLILCQAPTKGTVKKIVEMIFKEKVGVIAFFPVTQDNFKPISYYFPDMYSNCDYGEYKVIWDEGFNKINQGINVRELLIKNGVDDKHLVNVIQYDNWYNKDIPDDPQNFLQFVREISNRNTNKKPILVMCEDGAGRSGVFALVTYIIDTIRPERPFHPIKDVAFIRKHRYGAIYTTEQFIFSLTVVCSHYKESINKISDKTYYNFMSIAKKIIGNR